jgi:pimeloyl-ACP methyl ester carboxylesterase
MRITCFRLTFILLAAIQCFAVTPATRKLIPPPLPATAGPASITVGTLTLNRCGIAYCGTFPRPLDPAGEVPGTILISFEYFPQTDPSQPRAGALVATEGGPGYPTTGTRAYYLGLFLPIMAQRSLLLVDNRGTGGSAAVSCFPLQIQSQYTQSAIQTCGAEMGNTSDLFGTGPAADDLAAIIQALQLPPVDLYGDSYGTYFSQAFTARHPSLLRSVVLDSAYPVVGESPWYPEAPPAAQNAFNNACARSVTCQSQPGVSMDRIDALLDDVRSQPVTGIAHDGNGNPVQVTANAQGLAYVMFGNASGPVVYRELDAASRSWLDGDQAPFLRLIAENEEAAHPVQGSADVTAFSSGLFVAVSCTDYPQTYPMTSPLPVRAAQGAAAIAQEQAQDPTVFAPFTIDEFLQMPLDYSVVNLCLGWPVPSMAHPPGQPVPTGTVFPPTPVIVLSGDLDSLTPAAQGAEAAALFPDSQQIIMANSFHVTALADPYHCASNIVRNFVLTLSPGDTSCAPEIPEVHLVPSFALQASDLAPPTALSGNQGTSQELQVASAAAYTLGDAIARFWVNYDYSGVGLRGGTFSYTLLNSTSLIFTLDNMQWTEDTSVSGTATWDVVSGLIQASLQVSGPNSIDGTLSVAYSSWASDSMATLGGTLDGHTIVATMYAP